MYKKMATGLDYLHHGCKPPILHRDELATFFWMKNLEAKVADFGVSKVFPEEKSNVTTRVMGTPGYLDPE